MSPNSFLNALLKTETLMLQFLARRIPGRKCIEFLSFQFLFASKGLGYEFGVNGEEKLVRARFENAANENFLVFDVGANDGEYSQMVNSIAEKSGNKVEIHAFDIDERVKAGYKKRNLPRHVFNLTALGESIGEVEFNPNDNSRLNSLVANTNLRESMKRRIPIMSGDWYMENRGIDRIHLLKIDVEGYELNVIRGFDKALMSRKIDIVQFEYGTSNISQRHLLEDFDLLFSRYGYLLANLTGEGLRILEPLHIGYSWFAGPNWVAFNP